MKIGLFGGAFNPPHVEHKRVIDEAKKTLGLDKIIIIPSYLPPHKRTADGTPFELRVSMCALAFPDCEISEIERYSEDTNYTVNTLAKFKKIYPSDKLYFIIGGDSMADLFKWYKPEEILKQVEIVVYPRDGVVTDMLSSISKARDMGGKITLLNYKSNNISSAEIRYLSYLGAKFDEVVSPSVLKFISEHNLYNNVFTDILKDRVNDRTYAHSVRTAVWALRLNRQLALPIKDVFEASFLHDIAKYDTSTDGVPSDAYGTPVAHQFRGAEILKALGYSKNVVEAVRYHTTGCKDMTLIQKLVFCADMTEEGRDYEGLKELQDELISDFEKGFKSCVKRTYEHLLDKGVEIYYLTQDAYLFYQNE